MPGELQSRMSRRCLLNIVPLLRRHSPFRSQLDEETNWNNPSPKRWCGRTNASVPVADSIRRLSPLSSRSPKTFAASASPARTPVSAAARAGAKTERKNNACFAARTPRSPFLSKVRPRRIGHHGFLKRFHAQILKLLARGKRREEIRHAARMRADHHPSPFFHRERPVFHHFR